MSSDFFFSVGKCEPFISLVKVNIESVISCYLIFQPKVHIAHYKITQTSFCHPNVYECFWNFANMFKNV